MRWRPLVALQSTMQVELETPTPPGYARVPQDAERSAALAEALARLEVATRLRDSAAVARILDGLGESEDGQWLLRQCVAAGLREVAAAIADPAPQPSRSAHPAHSGAA